MSTVGPILLALTVALPVLGVAVYVFGNRDPVKARLKVLRTLLWLFAALTGISLVLDLRSWNSGDQAGFPLWTLVQLVSFAAITASLVYSIRYLRQRISNRSIWLTTECIAHREPAKS